MSVDTIEPSTTDASQRVEKQLLWIIRIGAACCFAGWAWQHLYWEGPYNRILWDDSVFSFVERFGFTWDEIVGDGNGAGLIQRWNDRVGWIYAALAVVSLTARKRSYVQLTALGIGSILLVALSYCKYVGALRQLPMFVEHGGQILIPVILIAALTRGVRDRVTIGLALIAFCMTFGGHGAYALGLWPTPAHFLGMTVVILHVSHETALVFLRIAGVLDYIVCVAIFVPALRKPAALYAAAWGLLTALARPVSGMSTEFNYFGADLFVHEAVLRAPHVAIPLVRLYPSF